MPALITHYLHALDVEARLAAGGIQVQRDAFTLGAQGPDAFYFHRIPPFQFGSSYRRIGFALHACDPDEIAGCFARYLLPHSEDTAASYALGFLCHYALDRTAHPFVYAVQKAIIEAERIKYNPGCVHSRIEHAIDVIMLREKQGMTGVELNPADCVTKAPEVIGPVAQEMKFVVNSLLAEADAAPEKVKQAFRDFRRNMKHSYDPHLYKRTLVRMLEKLLFLPPSASTFIRPIMEDGKADYSNFERALWRNPYSDEVPARDVSFFELFDEAVEDAQQLIEAFLVRLQAGMADMPITGKRSFKTGLPMTAEDLAAAGKFPTKRKRKGT